MNGTRNRFSCSYELIVWPLTMRIISPEQLHDVINPLEKGKLFDATTGTKTYLMWKAQEWAYRERPCYCQSRRTRQKERIAMAVQFDKRLLLEALFSIPSTTHMNSEAKPYPDRDEKDRAIPKLDSHECLIESSVLLPHTRSKTTTLSHLHWLRNRTCNVEPCLSTVKDSPKVGAPEIGFLNCRSTWQSCLLDKAFFSLPTNEKDCCESCARRSLNAHLFVLFYWP